MHLIPVLVVGLSLAFALPAAAQPVEIDEVRDMAFERGIVKLKEIELDDGIWEVEGKDARGRKIEMEVEADTGRIIKLKRD
jgi:uncharacterized membrane protein YkoI